MVYCPLSRDFGFKRLSKKKRSFYCIRNKGCENETYAVCITRLAQAHLRLERS
jgi:hypothetical protein